MAKATAAASQRLTSTAASGRRRRDNDATRSCTAGGGRRKRRSAAAPLLLRSAALILCASGCSSSSAVAGPHGPSCPAFAPLHGRWASSHCPLARSSGRTHTGRVVSSSALDVAVEPAPTSGGDRNGYPHPPASANGFHPDGDSDTDDDEQNRPLFDGRKSPFGSAALGKRRRPTLDALIDNNNDIGGGGTGVDNTNAAADTTDNFIQQSAAASASPSEAAATAALLLRRDRALLALQQHLGLNTTASLQILRDDPNLYDPLKCPSLSSKLLYLLNVVNLPKKRLRHMLLTKPTLTARVILDSETNLVGTIEVLQTELGLTSADILDISSGRLPAVLGYDRSELRRRIRAYRHDLGYPPEVLKRMVLRSPEILRTDGNWVKRSAEVLGEELGMNLEDVHRMVGRAHLVLTYDPEGNVRPTVQYLKEGIVGRCLGLVKRKGVSVPLALTAAEGDDIVRERVRDFILKFPHVLGLSVSNNLTPTLNFFLTEVGVPELGLGKMLTRRPALLELNIDKMRGKLAFLREELGVDGRQLAEMVVRFPDLFTLSIADNLGPKIAYFRGESLAINANRNEDDSDDDADDDSSSIVTQGLGMNSTQLQHVFSSKPQIFSLNLDRNIRPKVAYLTLPVEEGGAGLTPRDVRFWWAAYPQTVMCSLETLIRPRMELVRRAGLTFRPLSAVGVEEGDNDDAEDERRSDVPINFVWKPKRNWEDWVLDNTGEDIVGDGSVEEGEKVRVRRRGGMGGRGGKKTKK